METVLYISVPPYIPPAWASPIRGNSANPHLWIVFDYHADGEEPSLDRAVLFLANAMCKAGRQNPF